MKKFKYKEKDYDIEDTGVIFADLLADLIEELKIRNVNGRR